MMDIHQLIRNWQKGGRRDGDSPMPSNLRRNVNEDVYVDWDKYVLVDELLMDLPPVVRACFLAKYVSGGYNRCNHEQVARALPKEQRTRYVRLVLWWLEKKCCR